MTETRAVYVVNTHSPTELRLARHRIGRALGQAARALQQARRECEKYGFPIDVPPGTPILQAIEQLASLPARPVRKETA